MKKAVDVGLTAIICVLMLCVFNYLRTTDAAVGDKAQASKAISESVFKASEIADKGRNEKSQSSFRLPASLKRINESAFEGTAAQQVILPDGVQEISNGAFSGMRMLSKIYIPESVRYISDNAFDSYSFASHDNNSELVIYGDKNGFVQNWAKEHGYPFVQVNVPVAALLDGIKVFVFLLLAIWLSGALIILLQKLRDTSKEITENKSKYPQERIELHKLELCFP